VSVKSLKQMKHLADCESAVRNASTAHQTLATSNPKGAFQAVLSSRVHAAILGLVLALSLCLNLAGNSWGTPDRWHPDEMDAMAAGLLAQKSLNPHFFPYGGLHYYTLAVFAAAPVGVYNYMFDRKPPETDTRALAAWRERKDTRVHILARATSAVMATLTVLITCLIGTMLFGRTTGLAAALCLAVSPYVVLIAHFSTVETAANFWYWLAAVLGVSSWKGASRPRLALAAFVVGLAGGTKLDRLVAVIPWIAAGFTGRQRASAAARTLLLCAALIPLGYVVANPTLLLSFYEFVDGTVKDLAFNTLRGTGETSYGSMLSDSATGMGVALFAVSIASLAYLCVTALRGQWRREVAWLLAATLPMYLVYGPRLSFPWYSTLLYPGLAIAAAQGCVSLARAVPRPAAGAGITLIAAITAWSLLYSVAVDQQFIHDSRYIAAEWIETHVPAGASLEVSRRSPILEVGKYDIRHDAIPQDYYDNAREWRTHLDSSRLYTAVHAELGRLRLATGSNPDSQGPAYRAWFDRVTAPPPPAQEAATAGSPPDYRVVVDYLDGSLLRKLQAPGSHYEQAAVFHYRHPLGLDIPFAFVNPTIYVFRRNPAP